MTHLTRMSAAARGTTPATHVLIVDDSRTILNALGERLGQSGYLVTLCDRGADALDLIAGCRFDLVLLDVVMPEMSGLQVLAELRAAFDTADLPVIVTTSFADGDIAHRSLTIGADDFIAAPIDFDVFPARVERVLQRAARLAELKRANAALDARLAERAIELGEARDRLNAVRADRDRLAASLEALSRHLHTLSAQPAIARTSGGE